MKKLLYMLLFIFTFTLSACENPYTAPTTCDEGYELVNNECQEMEDEIICGEGEILNSETNECEQENTDPTCNDGFHVENGECVEDDPICTVNELLVDGECIERTCPADKALIEGECILISTLCEEGYTYEDGECVSLFDTLQLDIFYLNDTHGAILHDDEEIGFARMANFINAQRAENPNTLFVSGGDILQGSALSNYYLGESTIEILDEMGMDAFILGNHEFDWGLEEVTKYFDENEENGEADFPLLASNVFVKATGERPEYVEPYTVIETQDFKVGIIGVIGEFLEGSIATKRVEDYEFVDPLPYIEEYAIHLRTVEQVDFVFVVAHDTGNINDAVIALSGDAEVDAVFNGHSHSEYAYIDEIPVIQSGGNGEFLGHVEFTMNEDMIVDIDVENLDIFDDSLFLTPDPDVQTLIDFYLEDTEELFNTPIITAGEELYSNQLTQWIAKLIRVKTDSDIAFHNYGGTRRSVDNDTELTIGILYEVWPFDNVIKTVYLTGDEINSLLSSGGNGYSTEIDTFESDTLYKVATNDYVFDKEYNPFIYGVDPTNTGILLRELAIDELILQSSLFDEFLFNNEIQTQPDTYE